MYRRHTCLIGSFVQEGVLKFTLYEPIEEEVYVGSSLLITLTLVLIGSRVNSNTLSQTKDSIRHVCLLYT